jgi:hypothetical protein
MENKENKFSIKQKLNIWDFIIKNKSNKKTSLIDRWVYNVNYYLSILKPFIETNKYSDFTENNSFNSQNNSFNSQNNSFNSQNNSFNSQNNSFKLNYDSINKNNIINKKKESYIKMKQVFSNFWLNCENNIKIIE